jgi:hypothetical protein
MWITSPSVNLTASQNAYSAAHNHNPVIPGHAEDVNPESRVSSAASVSIYQADLDSGFAATRRPGMTYDSV